MQQAHSSGPGCVQVPGRRWGDVHPRRLPVLTVVVLALFFALLTVADLMPSSSDSPGLVAPVR